MQLSKEEYARKRIHNDSSVQIENSVARVTVRHHSASLVMPNSYRRDAISTSQPLTILIHSWYWKTFFFFFFFFYIYIYTFRQREIVLQQGRSLDDDGGFGPSHPDFVNGRAPPKLHFAITTERTTTERVGLELRPQPRPLPNRNPFTRDIPGEVQEAQKSRRKRGREFCFSFFFFFFFF